MPDFQLAGHATGYKTKGDITLRQLSSHTGGLPRETPYPCGSFDQSCDEGEVIKSLRTRLPVFAPNRKFHYSNFGFALLGRTLGHAMGGGEPSKPDAYERAMSEKVLRPLGMANATFSTADALKTGMVAFGTDMTGTYVNVSATCVPHATTGVHWGAPCG